MVIIVNNSSQQPIYEQIMDQVKSAILSKDIREHEVLPSVRSLAKDLKISALTVKKAYDNLEQDGFVVTVHGKGSYVSSVNPELMLEEHKKEVEADLELAIRKGRGCGMSNMELKSLFKLVLEETL